MFTWTRTVVFDTKVRKVTYLIAEATYLNQHKNS